MSASTARDRFGGTAAILLGISYVVVAIAYLLLPQAQREADPRAVLTSLGSDGQGAFYLLNWSLVVGAILAFAAIPAITGLVEATAPAVAGWGARLAYLGFAVGAVHYARASVLTPELARFYVQAKEPFEQLATVFDYFSVGIDPEQWFIFGAVGIWILVVGVLGVRSRTLPSLLGWAGIASGAMYWLIVAGNVFDTFVLITIAAILGGVVLAPLFYIGTGLRLMAGAHERSRRARSSSS